MEDWHCVSEKTIMKRLATKVSGLDEKEAESRLDEYGMNISAKEEKTSVAKIFFRQFKSFIIYILLGAAILSGIIGDYVEFLIISGIVLFIVLLSFFEEYKATSEMESLRKLTPRISQVIRGGKKMSIDSSELVPGDMIILLRGDIVPADGRVVESFNLQVSESALTGESVPITKTHDKISKGKSLAERKNMVYAGGQVTNGHGRCIIVATGKKTELGKIASMVKDAGAGLSPLQRRLDKLGKQFSVTVITICTIIIFLGILRGDGITNLLLLAVAVAVSGIPESLPAVIGVALAIGMKRMAKKNAIIKRLAAVETLGTCTVICSDKTGTLTQNKMVIENIWTCTSEVHVSGNGFNPEGIFLKEKIKIEPNEHSDVSKVLEIGILCNNADLKNEDKQWKVEGESTEGALLVLAKKAGMEKDTLHTEYPRIHEHPFDSERKRMSSIHLVNDQHIAYVKGAPERLLEKSSFYLENGKIRSLTMKKMEHILAKNEEYAKNGYRVLALAFKKHTADNMSVSDVEKDLVFVGLVSIRDPPEPSAIEAIMQCKDAGIKTIMITGDNPLTAKAVAQELGIVDGDQKILTGDELDQLSDKEYQKIVNDIAVYARVTPKHKLRVIKALQDKGEIVAMTGDGVNDAPALKKADIGIAMGLCGTEVAKEASEMVIKDDNFATIVHAVKEGRTIYSNIQKFIYYLLPGNMSEVLLILIASIFGFLPPLTAIMILFINVVTSEVPAFGLALEKSEDAIMHQRPRNPKEGILSGYILMKISQVVPLIVLGTIALYMWELWVKQSDVMTAQTIAFVSVILFELFHVFNAKSFSVTVFTKNTLKNKMVLAGVFVSVVLTLSVVYLPALNYIFGTVPLNLHHWVSVLLTASSVLAFVEIQKFIIKKEIAERDNHGMHPTRR